MTLPPRSSSRRKRRLYKPLQLVPTILLLFGILYMMYEIFNHPAIQQASNEAPSLAASEKLRKDFTTSRGAEKKQSKRDMGGLKSEKRERGASTTSEPLEADDISRPSKMTSAGRRQTTSPSLPAPPSAPPKVGKNDTIASVPPRVLRTKQGSAPPATAVTASSALKQQEQQQLPEEPSETLQRSNIVKESIHRLQMQLHGASNRSLTHECRFEGHCMEGFTCVADEASSMGGICMSYLPEEPNEEGNDDDDACFQACSNELNWEEYFFFQADPHLEWRGKAVLGNGKRPEGCLLRYHRKNAQDWSNFTEKKWWEATQPHHIVRIDAAMDHASENDTQPWVAFCYNPCKIDNDCGSFYYCHNEHKVCRPRESYWTPTPELQHDIVFVSGANSAYFQALMNLAASLKYWAPQHKLVVYNLGMSDSELEHIRNNTDHMWDNVLDLKWSSGIPDHYPPHVHLLKKYAWKPIAINESLHEYHSIFWLDSGCSVVGNMTEAFRIIHQTGIFLVKGQDEDMKPRAHRNTFSFLGHSKEDFVGGAHFAGGVQAHLYPSRYIDPIVEANTLCAIEEACVAPMEANLQNHRFDQTTLTILAYRDHLQLPHHTEFLAASRDQLKQSLNDSSFKFIWTSRGASKHYIQGKLNKKKQKPKVSRYVPNEKLSKHDVQRNNLEVKKNLLNLNNQSQNYVVTQRNKFQNPNFEYVPKMGSAKTLPNKFLKNNYRIIQEGNQRGLENRGLDGVQQKDPHSLPTTGKPIHAE